MLPWLKAFERQKYSWTLISPLQFNSNPSLTWTICSFPPTYLHSYYQPGHNVTASSEIDGCCLLKRNIVIIYLNLSRFQCFDASYNTLTATYSKTFWPGCIALDNSNRFHLQWGVRNIDLQLYNVAHILHIEERTMILCTSCALGKEEVQ